MTSFVPTSLMYKNIMDLNAFTGSDDLAGISVGTSNSYCDVDDECNWHFSIASSWGI